MAGEEEMCKTSKHWLGNYQCYSDVYMCIYVYVYLYIYIYLYIYETYIKHSD